VVGGGEGGEGSAEVGEYLLGDRKEMNVVGIELREWGTRSYMNKVGFAH
jgi:hypothetical protein